MLEYMWKQLVDNRKNLIKFAWDHLKADEITTKNWAYVNVCRFISVYDTPPKIIIQVLKSREVFSQGYNLHFAFQSIGLCGLAA